MKAYRESFRRMLELPFERAICPHRTGVFDRSVLERFYGALTDAALEAAPEVRIPPYERIHTCELTVDARQRLVFDRISSDAGGRGSGIRAAYVCPSAGRFHAPKTPRP